MLSRLCPQPASELHLEVPEGAPGGGHVVRLQLALEREQRAERGAELGVIEHPVSRAAARKAPAARRSARSAASRPARTTPSPRSLRAHRATPRPPARPAGSA